MDMSVRSLGDADISNVLKYTPHLTSTEHSLVSVKPKNINHISLGLNITWNLFNLKMNHIFVQPKNEPHLSFTVYFIIAFKNLLFGTF